MEKSNDGNNKKPGRPKNRFVTTKKKEATKPVRIPLSKVEEVKKLIKG